MPKDTFFRLPKEKQKRLLKAARHEFKHNSFDKASISAIIEEAKIPRGSFYQYFEDKADIYAYVIDDFRNEALHNWAIELKKQNGNLFAAFRILGRKVLSYVINHSTESGIYQNMLLHFDYSNYRNHANISPGKVERWDEIEQGVDLEQLKVNSMAELNMLVFQMVGIVFATLRSYFFAKKLEQPLTEEQTMQRFETLTDWLEFGVRQP